MSDAAAETLPAKSATVPGTREKSLRVTFRLSPDDFGMLMQTALAAQITPSAVLRRRLHCAPILAKTDVALRRELRRQIGLLKHLHRRGARILDVVEFASDTVDRIEAVLNAPDRDLSLVPSIARSDGAFIAALRHKGAGLKACFDRFEDSRGAAVELVGEMRRIEAAITARPAA